MKKGILILALISINAFLAAQSGVYMNFKYSSSKGISGNLIMKHSDFGTKSEIKMVSQKQGGGMTMTTLLKKDHPELIYMLNDAAKTYTEMKKAEAVGSTEDKGTYTVKKIGNEMINGYKCIHALVTEGKNTTEVWNTKDIPEFLKYSEAIKSDKNLASSKRDQALKDAGCDGFPVKMIRKGNQNDGDVTMELLSCEKKSYSKSDFDIPAGYTKSSGPAMPAGMPQIKTQQEIMNMTPAEREKYAEEMKKLYGGGK